MYRAQYSGLNSGSCFCFVAVGVQSCAWHVIDWSVMATNLIQWLLHMLIAFVYIYIIR